MTAVPIDTKARGAILEARDSFADFAESVQTALPALEHCGVADVQLKASWLRENLKQLKICMEFLFENTTEAHRNAFPEKRR